MLTIENLGVITCLQVSFFDIPSLDHGCASGLHADVADFPRICPEKKYLPKTKVSLARN